MSFLEGYSGAGTVRLQLIVDGVRTGALLDAGNITSLVPVVAAEREDIISRRVDTARQVLDGFSAISPLKVNWKGNTLFKNIWDMLMLGTVLEYSEQAIVDEPFTVPVVDEWVPFGDLEAFPGHVLGDVTDSTGVTTYVLDTDYEYRQVDGAIKVLSTGAISVDDIILGGLTRPATGFGVDMNTTSEKKVRMLVQGVNEFNDRATFLQLHSVSNSPSSNPDMQAGGVQEYEFEGTCETPDGFTSPGSWHYVD